MKKSAILMFIYGALLIVGGLMGYLKAGSTVSLALGLIFGGLVIFNGVGIWQKCLVCHGWGVALALGLAGLFGYRLFVTEKFMPSGMMLAVSLIVAVLLLLWRKKD